MPDVIEMPYRPPLVDAGIDQGNKQTLLHQII